MLYTWKKELEQSTILFIRNYFQAIFLIGTYKLLEDSPFLQVCFVDLCELLNNFMKIRI